MGESVKNAELAAAEAAAEAAGMSRRWLIAWGGASLVAVAAVLWVLARGGHQSVRPAPTDDPVTISKYVGTPDFLMQGFDEQRAYLFTLRKSVEPIQRAYAARKLDESQYRMARAGAWMGGKLEHLRAYLKETTPQGRNQYLDKMLSHRQEKKAAATAAAATGPASDAEDTAYFYSAEVKKIVASWSKRRRAEWDEFHQVTHERKQQIAASAAAAATGGSK
jgi:hypothetical protein